MLLRKEQRDSTEGEKYLLSLISGMVQPLLTTPIVFLDQIYRMVRYQVSSIKSTISFPRYYVTKRSVPDATLYSNLAFSSWKVSELAQTLVPDIYSSMNGISDTLLSTAEGLTDDITDLQSMSEIAQAKLIRKMSATSIKTDSIVYESFTNNNTFDIFENTFINTSAGSLCLSATKTTGIDFRLENISVDKNKGELKKTKDIVTGDSSYIFSDGFYYNRTYSINPIFEKDSDNTIYKMRDGDITSEYRIEYCSENDSEKLTLKLTVTPTVISKIDILNIVFSPCDTDSALSATNDGVYLSKVLVTMADQSTPVDVLSSFADNTIVVRNTTYGSVEDRPTLVSPYIYPSYAIPIFKLNVKSIDIELVCDRPQKIYYLNKAVYDHKGTIVSKFNFLESLVLNKYIPPYGRLDPQTLFTKSQISDFNSIVKNGYSVTDLKVPAFRYSIGIRELSLNDNIYSKEGVAVTSNLNESDKEVYSVELFVNEDLHLGATRYFVSTDKVTWIEIEPANRNINTSLPNRVLFVAVDDSKDRDFLYPAVTKKVYAKVYLAGDTTYSPVIKSFLARVKHI